MTSRAESAAQTRRALLDAAATLLEVGGPAAVTLRAVGEQAGVSRGAPYGHFEGKSHLLAEPSAELWMKTGRELAELSTSDADPRERLREAMRGIVRLGIEHRPTYELMFVVPDEHFELVSSAAEGAQDVFIGLVAEVVGDASSRRVAALLMTGAHGIAAMAASGHLRSEKWGVEAPELIDDLVAAATRGTSR